ncbi:hypothetical protein CR513_31350, partial [Mucuna pruriens]
MLRGVAMQWFSRLPSRTIHNFNDLVTYSLSQLVANRAKKLEIANLFDIKQMKGENLKKYLTHFNSVMIQVNDPDQKFFGLHVGHFSDSVALRGLTNKEEIRAQVEKHIKAQTLADFITELTLVKEIGDAGKEWILSVDGASNKKGSNAKTILEGPDSVMIEQSLWTNMMATRLA